MKSIEKIRQDKDNNLSPYDTLKKLTTCSLKNLYESIESFVTNEKSAAISDEKLNGESEEGTSFSFLELLILAAIKKDLSQFLKKYFPDNCESVLRGKTWMPYFYVKF